MDPNSTEWNQNEFVAYYKNLLCNFQSVNHDVLKDILQKNQSCPFFLDRSILLLSRDGSARTDEEYGFVDEFREKVALTAYEDYRSYVDRMVVDGEKYLLCPEDVVYYAITSATTAKSKFLPLTTKTIANVDTSIRLASYALWKSLPSTSYPSSQQKPFSLIGGKNAEIFPRSKDGTPYGPISQYLSACPTTPRTRTLYCRDNILSLDIIEKISDFHTNAFVQLVCALATPNIYSYTVYFATGFIHSVKFIENYFEEMSLCISCASFDHSSLVQNTISDLEFKSTLSRTLHDIIINYGGETYALKRAEHIRNECRNKDSPGILHRLWPNLAYACTTFGGTFSMYKDKVRFYCGDQLPLVNGLVYGASEGFFGFIAGINTDEYILLPTNAFYEFIREEDVKQTQPKTLLMSEIEPGQRYELVCTTEAGLVRYRMGDMVTCTRFLCRADNLVPLREQPLEIPRIPLVSIGYRLGSLLDAFGEKTNELHVLNALLETIQYWREQGIPVDLGDFTSYCKLDVFPAKYVIFLELIEDEARKLDGHQLRVIRSTSGLEMEKRLCKTNQYYETMRRGTKLDPLHCILVQKGTFSKFSQKFFMANRGGSLQTKPHRILKNDEHIRFFSDNQIELAPL